ncbi:head-tail connector protein [Paracoccus sp. Z330]|uniref:Head-tail connector protein n=1 Tax=Paracoccus onchidii TaxID=3017813 RepID=A0ABT4ZLB7_9RHOB|nr:head-tail connector protein [Paracoccus onchidii]MDB6179551.1 head-tail connector protein [Paracoccus onchidii]
MIVNFSDLCAQAGVTGDAPKDDLMSLQSKGDAAQNHIERMLGYRIEAEFGGEDQEPIPEALKEAVLQLACWWFEHREAVSDRDKRLPYGVDELVAAYRDWTF